MTVDALLKKDLGFGGRGMAGGAILWHAHAKKHVQI